jgi:hypothetical protein
MNPFEIFNTEEIYSDILRNAYDYIINWTKLWFN